MTAVIHTERLTKTYGIHRGITEVDLDVEGGEIFGFLGPNGAGKTTTMRVLLDLIRPTSGRAEVFGIETTKDPVAIHRRVGYLPGEFDLYDRLTGADTITYFANLRGGVDPAYVAELVERLDLDPSRRFKEYSKGNKQKVGLVVALQHKPDLLILDEPTSGLDPLIQQSFFEVVREAKTEGRTIFLSSHVIDEVDRTCDRVAIIREGRLVQVDRIENIRPAVALEQKNPVRTARSTVGTATEVYDYLRLLWARVGRSYCRACGAPGASACCQFHKLDCNPEGRANSVVSLEVRITGEPAYVCGFPAGTEPNVKVTR